MAEKEKEWQAAIEQLSCPACPTAAATAQQIAAVPSTVPTVPAQVVAAEPAQVVVPAPAPLIAAPEDPPPAEDPESDDPNRLVPPEVAKYLPNMVYGFSAETPTLGDPKNARVTMMVYGDFECPYSAQTVPLIREIHKRYPKDVSITFRNLPIDNHEQAVPAARAALAANRQGKFWEYHDALYEVGQTLSDSMYTNLATKLGLDLAKFRTDLADKELEYRVQADTILSGRAGANATPTMLLNGRRYIGAMPFSSFKHVIEGEIERVNDLMESEGLNLFAARGRITESNFKRNARTDDRHDESLDALVRVPLEGTPLKGAKDPMVGIIVFSDFECSHCANAEAVVKRLMADFPDKIAFGFRHHPMHFHQKARFAAQAAAFAQSQGKFWEMHDKLYANQNALGETDIRGYMQELGLDLNIFDQTQKNQSNESKVLHDLKVAAMAGVQATPTFSINGRLKEGVLEYDIMKATVQQAVDQAEDLISRSIATREGYYGQLVKLIPRY
jgi:protein-disulfide isomerase